MRLGRYVLLARIGAGGMSEVWKAQITGPGGWSKLVVVKIDRTDRLDRPLPHEVFRDEARLSALLNHPNLVQAFEVGEAEGTRFMALEYLSGRDLGTVERALERRRETIPARLAVCIALAVTRGLAHVHELRDGRGQPLHVVHRDVSPSNVMLLWSGGVKLIDFGVASSALARLDVWGEGRYLVGKLPYMSPEQASGEAVDARSDLFSVGVVLWEMLTGRTLFRGRTALESLQNVMTRPVPPPSTIVPSTPRVLDRIVAKALDRNVDRRYQTAAELASDLDAVLCAHPCPAGAVPELLERLFSPPGPEDEVPRLAPVPSEADGSSPFVATLRRAIGSPERGAWLGRWARRASLATMTLLAAALASLLAAGTARTPTRAGVVPTRASADVEATTLAVVPAPSERELAPPSNAPPTATDGQPTRAPEEAPVKEPLRVTREPIVIRASMVVRKRATPPEGRRQELHVDPFAE